MTIREILAYSDTHAFVCRSGKAIRDQPAYGTPSVQRAIRGGRSDRLGSQSLQCKVVFHDGDVEMRAVSVCTTSTAIQWACSLYGFTRSATGGVVGIGRESLLREFREDSTLSAGIHIGDMIDVDPYKR